MADIKITLDNSAITARLQQLSAVLDKPRPLMLQIAETLHAQSMRLFEQQGFPAKSWPDLRPATRRARARQGHWPGKILQVTGQLASSVLTAAGDDYAQIGTNRVYAAIQHLGGTIERSGHVRLRTNRKGELLKRGNLATFAKRSHKQAVARAVNYSIVIKPRPFLPMTSAGQLIPPAFEAVMTVLNAAFLAPR